MIAYSLSIYIYYLGIQIVAFFGHSKAKMWLEGRKATDWISLSNLGSSGAIKFWFHCASLGEFEQGRPLLEAIKATYPAAKIILTFYSPSGYNIQKNYPLADWIGYLPLDTKQHAAKFCKLANPDVVLWVKYDFWLHHLKTLCNSNALLVLVAGIFRENHAVFKTFTFGLRKTLSNFDKIFVQDAASAQRLQASNFTNIQKAPDTRFDRVHKIAKASPDLSLIKGFIGTDSAIVFGSSWPKDEKFIGAILQQTKLKVIVAPHNINEKAITTLIATYANETIRYTKYDSINATKKRVLIIDNIGLLSSIYQLGKYVFIGGGFGAGIHNILEAAVYGMPLFFGPNFSKAMEATTLVNLNSAHSIQFDQDLIEQIKQYESDYSKYAESAHINKQYVVDNLGGTSVIMNYLDKQFKQIS